MEVGSAENAGAIFSRSIPGRSSHRHPWLFATYGPSLDVKKPLLLKRLFTRQAVFFLNTTSKTFIRQEQSTGQEFPNPACRHDTILFCVLDNQISVSF